MLLFFKKKWAIPGLFFCLFSSFQYSCQYTNVPYKSLPMTGFKPRTSGVGSDRSTNWATTTAQMFCFFVPCTIFSLGIIIFSSLIMNKLALFDPSYLVRKSFPLLGIKHRVALKSLRLWSGRLDFSALEQPLLGTRVALSRCLLSKLFIEKASTTIFNFFAALVNHDLLPKMLHLNLFTIREQRDECQIQRTCLRCERFI